MFTISPQMVASGAAAPAVAVGAAATWKGRRSEKKTKEMTETTVWCMADIQQSSEYTAIMS